MADSGAILPTEIGTWHLLNFASLNKRVNRLVAVISDYGPVAIFTGAMLLNPHSSG